MASCRYATVEGVSIRSKERRIASRITVETGREAARGLGPLPRRARAPRVGLAEPPSYAWMTCAAVHTWGTVPSQRIQSGPVLIDTLMIPTAMIVVRDFTECFIVVRMAMRLPPDLLLL